MNYDLFRTINDWSGNRALDDLMKVLAKDLVFVVFAVFAVLCGTRMRDRDLRPVGYAFGGLVLTFLFAQVAAKVHPEARPFTAHPPVCSGTESTNCVHQLIAHAPGQSFPSDHATAAFGVALAAMMFLDRSWGLILAVAGLAIGFARVYDGVHYPGDIAGAFLAAVLGVGVMVIVARLRPAAPSGALPVTPRR